ncbi:Trehalose synthase [uncultured archaeon]|nr:Trehalose synthase [uncultured archaeon]
MRVLVAAPYYPPEGGGLEVYAESMAQGVSELGHDVSVLCGTASEGGRVLDGMVDVVRVHPSVFVSNTPVSASVYRIAMRIIREKRIEAVVVHTPVPGVADAVAFAARRAGVPYGVVYHNRGLIKGRRFLDSLARVYGATAESSLLSNAKSVAGVGDYVADFMRKRVSNVRSLPPGVDLELFSPAKNYPPYRLLFVGQLSSGHSWKGLDVLLSSFHMIKAKFPEAELTVAGGGHIEPSLSRRNGVRFIGRVLHDEMAEVYRGHTLVVAPSLSAHEGFGISVLEAAACGVPAVASRTGGLQFFVKDGVSGVLVSPGDLDCLNKEVVGLLSDSKRLGGMRVEARKAAGKFPLSAAVKAFESFALEVAG